MSETIYELVTAVIILLCFLHILRAGKRDDLRSQEGWGYLLAGFGLIFIAKLLDATDDVGYLSRFIVLGDTPYEDFIEEGVCSLGGFLLLTIGVQKWLPLGVNLRATEKKLRRINAELETEASERHLAKEALMIFRKLIDQTNDALFVVDAVYGGIVDVNLKACENLGYEWHELLRMKVTDIEVTLPDEEAWKAHEKEAMQAGKMMLTGLHKRKDGSTFPVEISVKHTTINGRALIIAIARDITERRQQEEEKEKLFAELQKALENVKILSGFLPICSFCKNIRDDHGLWGEIENYIKDHSEMDFTHSICPACAKKEYSDFVKKG